MCPATDALDIPIYACWTWQWQIFYAKCALPIAQYVPSEIYLGLEFNCSVLEDIVATNPHSPRPVYTSERASPPKTFKMHATPQALTQKSQPKMHRRKTPITQPMRHKEANPQTPLTSDPGQCWRPNSRGYPKSRFSSQGSFLCLSSPISQNTPSALRPKEAVQDRWRRIGVAHL